MNRFQVSTTMWEGKDGVDEPLIPIVRPLKDYVCYVLDPETNTPVTPGKDGVLFVSGPGVAIGCLVDSEEVYCEPLGQFYSI
jgi:hypothetical protein